MKSNRIFFTILLFAVIATGAAGCAASEKSSVNKPVGGGADPVVYEVLARALALRISQYLSERL